MRITSHFDGRPAVQEVPRQSSLGSSKEPLGTTEPMQLQRNSSGMLNISNRQTTWRLTTTTLRRQQTKLTPGFSSLLTLPVYSPMLPEWFQIATERGFDYGNLNHQKHSRRPVSTAKENSRAAS